MTVKDRILVIRLSEKLDKRPAYSQQLGVSVQLQRTAARRDDYTDISTKKGRE